MVSALLLQIMTKSCAYTKLWILQLLNPTEVVEILILPFDYGLSVLIFPRSSVFLSFHFLVPACILIKYRKVFSKTKFKALIIPERLNYDFHIFMTETIYYYNNLS